MGPVLLVEHDMYLKNNHRFLHQAAPEQRSHIEIAFNASVMPCRDWRVPIVPIVLPMLNKHRIYKNKFDFDHICSKNVVLTPKACFLNKKNAGRPRTGIQPKVIFTEMPTLMHIVFKY